MRERDTGKDNLRIFIERVGQMNNAELDVLDLGMNLPTDAQPKWDSLNPLVLETVIKFLNAPTVTDRFNKDHEKRRDFYSVVKAECEDLFQWFETNRLRWNSIYVILMIIDSLLPADETLKSIKDKARKISVQAADEYNNLSKEEKVKVVNELASLTYELYLILIKK
ncbi:MAG: hypothetical protein GW942_00095 [Candidatus Pacebacteria bacterium]|nr:hypothetical protein [Candidatus Paceibacterota bacterium]